MAQETLGVWGGNLATVAYLFLRYTCVVAYTSKSGEVLSHLIGLPASTLGNLFTLLVALLILVGGMTITDQVNQWLTVTMIGLLVLIEAMSVSFGGGTVSVTSSDWAKAPQTTCHLCISRWQSSTGEVLNSFRQHRAIDLFTGVGKVSH
ncbi:uncharacterized protein LOC135644531 isoform X2 [Musa acuminata AAA Group]|uniref:uncharacterized protein LOC135644531 isoform X2 n=1 Tax=Musa acuminata AAA Group TaxID=214697 RepID=UPI0031D21617